MEYHYWPHLIIHIYYCRTCIFKKIIIYIFSFILSVEINNFLMNMVIKPGIAWKGDPKPANPELELVLVKKHRRRIDST